MMHKLTSIYKSFEIILLISSLLFAACGIKTPIADQHPEVLNELKTKMESWTATLPETYIRDYIPLEERKN